MSLLHPSTDVSLGLSFSMVSACLHTYIYSNYFMEICEYIIIRLSRSFLKVLFDSSLPQLLASDAQATRKRGGGTPGFSLQPHPPWLLQHMLSGKPHWSPSLPSLNLLLIPKVSILSEQMEFCFSQNTFFLILTKE